LDKVIDVQNVVKTFGDFRAVDNVSFSVDRGVFFGLLGPNGAGKTTTIRMLYGFSPLTEGEIRVFGQDIRTGWREIRGRIGVCQQENTLDPDLTVIQNLQVFAGYFAIPWIKALNRAEELLDFFALFHKRDERVMDLSGGMVRRLMLARALINKPDLLILDEPTTGLDPQSRHQLWTRLEELKTLGLTLLLTTHYMEEAARLCDRLLIVDHGRVLVEGKPADLIQDYIGNYVIEIEEPDVRIREYLAGENIAFDDLGNRLVIYTDNGADVEGAIRERFCVNRCTYRNGSLEDVFLRLTGRELRD